MGDLAPPQKKKRLNLDEEIGERESSPNVNWWLVVYYHLKNQHGYGSHGSFSLMIYLSNMVIVHCYVRFIEDIIW